MGRLFHTETYRSVQCISLINTLFSNEMTESDLLIWHFLQRILKTFQAIPVFFFFFHPSLFYSLLKKFQPIPVWQRILQSAPLVGFTGDLPDTL